VKLKKKQSAIEMTLADLVELLPQVASAYLEVLQAPLSQREVKAGVVASFESEADDRHLALVRDVGNTFITPYDREDLFDLLENLDDIIDDFDLAAQTCAAIPLETVPEPLIRSAKEVQSMALLLSRAVHLIKEPEDLLQTLMEANRHYAAIRRQYVSFLGVALRDGASPIEALRGKIIADQIEGIAGEIESFGRSIGVMAIKET
jgi:uncharacterized protein Yka (UPF0111/DUF47 family)